MAFVDSETYRNIITAYQRELVACGTYLIYERKARTDGFKQIGNIFEETANNERQHAEIWLRVMNDGEIPFTLTNLQNSTEIEIFEGTDLYIKYAETARAEGYEDIANLFDGIAAIERHHAFRYNQLADNIQNNRVFCKENRVVWICLSCGNLVWSDCAPEICPICKFPQGFYEINCENY